MDYSSLSGIWKLGIYAAVTRLETVVDYTRKYLNRLAQHGHHVIYSVPLSVENPGPFSLTSVDFQFVSSIVRTLVNHRRVRIAPVILVTGMVNHRPLHKTTLVWHDAWISPKSYGTIVLSRETFLDKRLLPIFAKVNAKTTVVPRFSTLR